MPRKYHRPPAVKRRKSKKTSPFVSEGAPEPENGDAADLTGQPDDFQEEEGDIDEPVAARQFAVAKPETARGPSRHLMVDHSYVRSEVIRILGLAAFLIVSLIITAIFRN